MLNENLTKEEAQWLLNDFAPKIGGLVSGSTISKYYQPARELMTGKPSEIPSCGCHYLAYAKTTQSMFSQHQAAIKEIANKKTTRGRRKTKKS